MSNENNRKRIKKKINKKKKRSKAPKKMEPKNTTSISKKNVSINWLTFMGPNGLRGNNIKSLNDENKKEKRTHKKPPEITKVLAIDCEMVSDLNDEDMLARISVVNFRLECVYDKYVKPTAKVGDFRTRFSGIREEDLVNGEDFETVRKEVKQMLYNKILVGHALGNDFKVLKFGHHKQLIRDTSRYDPFREVTEMKSPSLKKLAKVLLGETIQEGEHSSIEDAKTAMKLYKKYRKEWEVSLFSSKLKTQVQSHPEVQPEVVVTE